MLYLQFKIEQNHFIIPSLQIIEVVPFVPLNPIHRSTKIFSGEFNFRGQLLPVLDIKMLLTGKNSQKLLSTRIVVVRTNTMGENRKIGLIAEKATETMKLHEKDFQEPILKNIPFLGDVAMIDGISYQKIIVDNILSFTPFPNLDSNSST